MNSYYYLYVFYKDNYGTYNLIKGSLFFDINSAIDSAKRFLSILGNHAQIIDTNKSIVVFEH